MALTPITDADLLTKVKTALGITGTYQNETIQLYINEAKEFMKYAGISENVVNSTLAIGVISRGVADLWNYGAGNAALSEYFKQRVSQLVLYGDNSTTSN